MLYLIKDHDYLKIGYASNIKNRKKAYRTHTLYTEGLDIKFGTIEDEDKLHDLCKPGQVESEGFQNCQDVIDIGNNYTSAVESDLDNINKILEEFDEELSKQHLKLFETFPADTSELFSILKKIDYKVLMDSLVSIDFKWADSEKYKNTEKNFKDFTNILNAFEGRKTMTFFIDEYKYKTERINDGEKITIKLIQTIKANP